MRFILLLILFCSFIQGAYTQSTLSKETARIHNVVKDFFDGIAEWNILTCLNACTPDVIILETGVIWTMDTIVQRINNKINTGGEFRRINDLEFLDTDIQGEVAWLYYNNHASISFNGTLKNIHWLESAVLRRIDGR